MIENCKMRHENGNCLPAGGFCTANKNICEALQQAYDMGRRNTIKEIKEKAQIKREKQECIELAEQNKLVMSDEKCKSCEHLYECRYMFKEMNSIVYGD